MPHSILHYKFVITIIFGLKCLIKYNIYYIFITGFIGYTYKLDIDPLQFSR